MDNLNLRSEDLIKNIYERVQQLSSVINIASCAISNEFNLAETEDIERIINLLSERCETVLTDINNYIDIKGYLNPVNFMNDLYKMISDNFGDDCSLIPDNKKLKIVININDDNAILKLSILVKLYKYPDGHILRCKQKEGNRKDFFKFEKISNWLKK